jgi:hypothetical protein
LKAVEPRQIRWETRADGLAAFAHEVEPLVFREHGHTEILGLA